MEDNHDLIQNALANWDLEAPYIEEQLKENSARPVFKIKTDNTRYILKGFSDEMPESTIMSNVRAHLFLGNEKALAPRIFPAKTGEYYISDQGYRFYLMEYIEGRQMQETPEDEFRIGQAAGKLHALKGYSIRSPFTQSKKQYYEWFRNRSFVKEYDAILDHIPDFEQLDQCFVHTDLGPHNMMLGKDGRVVFVDLDDAGIGSRYLDLGWPFIMQFVDFDHETEEMHYRFDLAESFLRGYYGEKGLTREEYDLIFYGAEQMHISYMQTYGPYAVESLWKILKYGIDQKEILWRAVRNLRFRNMEHNCGFTEGNKWFRYRAAAIIVEDDHVLFAGNEKDDYYYSIGGAVHMGETAEDAVIREVFEETGVRYEIDHLAVIHENFFNENMGALKDMDCHEIALYFMMRSRGSRELKSNSYTQGVRENMYWLPVAELDKYRAFPTFMKEYLQSEHSGIVHIVTDERS